MLIKHATTTAVDYGAIVQALEEASDKVAAIEINRSNGGDICRFLREFRTIGVTGPRQTGKTSQFVKKVMDDPNSILICANSMTRNFILSLVTFDQQPELKRRTFLSTSLKLEIDRKVEDRKFPAFTKIYIDDATYVFLKVRRGKFYEWLASLNISNPLIILIG